MAEVEVLEVGKQVQEGVDSVAAAAEQDSEAVVVVAAAAASPFRGRPLLLPTMPSSGRLPLVGKGRRCAGQRKR